MPLSKASFAYLLNCGVNSIRATAFCLIALCSNAIANSFEYNSTAPIEIEADTAEQNESLGLITYRGNVQISQGGLEITADKVSIQSEKPEDGESRQLKHITATGAPARFSHAAESSTERVQAEAETIFFELGKSTISLTNNALLKQNNSSVSGDFIEYLIEQRRVKAKSLNPEGGGRVHTVITPNNEGLLPALN